MALTRYEPPAFLEGLLCAMAASSVLALMDSDVGALAPAAFAGIWFAIFSIGRGGIARHSVSSIFGLCGSVAAFIDLDASMSRLGVDAWPALLWGAALVAFAAFAWLHGFLLRPRSARDPWEAAYWPLTLFGALETLAFFVLPYGVSLHDTASPALGFVTSLVGTIVLGAFVGYAPNFALAVFPVVIGVAVLGATALIGVPGSAGPQLWGIGAVAAYVVLYAGTKLAITLLLGRRAVG